MAPDPTRASWCRACNTRTALVDHGDPSAGTRHGAGRPFELEKGDREREIAREIRRGTSPSVTCNNQCASHSPRNALVMLDARGWASKRWQLMATTGGMVHVEPTSLMPGVRRGCGNKGVALWQPHTSIADGSAHNQHHTCTRMHTHTHTHSLFQTNPQSDEPYPVEGTTAGFDGVGPGRGRGVPVGHLWKPVTHQSHTQQGNFFDYGLDTCFYTEHWLQNTSHISIFVPF